MQKNQNNVSLNSRKTVLIKTVFFLYICEKKVMYKFLARINKLLLPSFTKKRLDLAKAKKWQMAIIGYRYYVTTRAVDY
jgi:hypothetical protein